LLNGLGAQLLAASRSKKLHFSGDAMPVISSITAASKYVQ
jgi:hypothetical protein